MKANFSTSFLSSVDPPLAQKGKHCCFLSVVALLLSIIFLSLLPLSCTREDAPTSDRNSLLSDLYNQSENYSIKKFLPINLSQYNLSPSSSFSSSQSSGTKSSGEYNLDDFTFSFDADSLLSDSGIRQRLFEDEDTIGLWAYTEFPFRSNGSIYASITKDKSHLVDSLVSLKSYYVLVENPTRAIVPNEYFATMIPTHHYFITNPDYSFLEKSSFSGIILYSTLEGEFIRSENYSSGVITHTTLKKRDAVGAKSSPMTKNNDDSMIDLGELYCVHVVAELPPQRPKHLDDINFDYLDDIRTADLHTEEVLDYVDKKEGGGANNKAMKVSITVYVNHCDSTIFLRHTVSKGSPFNYSSPFKFGTKKCLLLGVVCSDSKYNSNDYNIVVDNSKKNLSFEIKYSSNQLNSDCYELLSQLYIGNGYAIVGELLNDFSRNVENLYYYVAGQFFSHIGSDCSAIANIGDGFIESCGHTHNRGYAPFPSPVDFATMCINGGNNLQNGQKAYNFSFDIANKIDERHYRLAMIRLVNRHNLEEKIKYYEQKAKNDGEEYIRSYLEDMFLNKYSDLFGSVYPYPPTTIYVDDYYEDLYLLLLDFGFELRIVDAIKSHNSYIFRWSDSDPNSKYLSDSEKDNLNNCFNKFSPNIQQNN